MDNEIADNLAKLACKKANHLSPRTDIFKVVNKQINVNKWGITRREKSKFHKHKQNVPTLSINFISQGAMAPILATSPN